MLLDNSKKPRGLILGVPHDWIDKINGGLDHIAQALPYAKIQLSTEPNNAVVDNTEKSRVVIFDETVYFHLKRNDYYNRKHIDNDDIFLNEGKVKRFFDRALHAVLRMCALEIERHFHGSQA